MEGGGREAERVAIVKEEQVGIIFHLYRELMLLMPKIGFYKSVCDTMRKTLLQFMGITDFQCDSFPEVSRT